MIKRNFPFISNVGPFLNLTCCPAKDEKSRLVVRLKPRLCPYRQAC